MSRQKLKGTYLIKSLFLGLLIPFGFAPFHYPGLAILGIALLFSEINNLDIKQSIRAGLLFGIGYMGFGISWVYLSINSYGHLNIPVSLLITTIFIIYNALFYAAVICLYKFVSIRSSKLLSCFLFSACYCLGEFARANLGTGFPWLLLGFGQIDTPLRYLLPFIGVYGVGFVSVLASSLLVYSNKKSKYKIAYLISFVIILLFPLSLKNYKTSNVSKDLISVAAIQANLAMRDNWDEDLFLQMLNRYHLSIKQLAKQTDLIILPESSIPVPANYASSFISEINKLAKNHNTTLLIGIPKSANKNESKYLNTLLALGINHGFYSKQHLVPFGEYIPKPFAKLADLLNIPDASMTQGNSNQALLKVKNHHIASLICYEIAYPELLRKQLPKAKWIVSISDDGWFGHSLAIYQQQQMSQVLSILSGRYQVVANNDGLSSIIDNKGNILNSARAFSSEDLCGNIHSATGRTIWVVFGDKPFLFLSILITIIAFFKQRRYS
ncbi:MAG: apolipoprotein N-acyltransferase [Legionellales bacterium RIFCSPHIGHO2_12_FULL_35_11]|nr:MAG: apolipoprotein N-acyltransferase [Legionellales bacterium RIFCSPHIGHO2_12_FULL_35_11]